MTDEPRPSQPSDVPLQTYIDSQIAEVRRAADLALQSAKGEAVPLREFITAILDEQRRGMVVAEQERKKAADALADTLARQINQGDQALQDHIAQQIGQIREALNSAERLAQTRLTMLGAEVTAAAATAEQHVAQLRREREIVTAAQMEAIAKAETATEKRFESVNEFRAQLSDTIANFLPREVADAQIGELRQQLTSLTNRFNTMVGADTGAASARAGLTANAMAWIAGLGLLVAVLSIAVVVILANGGGP